MGNNIPIILASASPRRAELLKQAGFTFTVNSSTVEEIITETSPDKMAEDLAFQKADEVYQRLKAEYRDSDYIVIGADTIVYYNGEILGKPTDEQDAFNILKMLSDRTHQVFTGVALIVKSNGEKQTYLLNERTDVTFYPINDYELKEYISTGDPLDKAGAYGIQGPFAVHIKEIKGDYNNVVGLPIARIYQTIKNSALTPCLNIR